MEGVQWPRSPYPVCRIPRDRQPRPRQGRKESEPTSLHVPFRHNKSARLPQLSACYILHSLGTRKSGSDADKTTRPTFRAYHHYGRFLFTPFFRLPWMRRREKGKKSDIAPVPREGGTTEPQRGNTTCNRPRRGRPPLPLSPPSLLSNALSFPVLRSPNFFLPTVNKHASRKLPFE